MKCFQYECHNIAKPNSLLCNKHTAEIEYVKEIFPVRPLWQLRLIILKDRLLDLIGYKK